MSHPSRTDAPAASSRTGLDAGALERDLRDNLFFRLARFPAVATPNDWYLALAYVVRNRLLQRWVRTAETYFERKSRTVCYLSAEFLLGPHLGNVMLNLGITDAVRAAVAACGQDLDALLDREEEPGLGNGGLGRLAACYLDSLATLQIPSIGYGIRYEFGIFDQEIRDGRQVEIADRWLRWGNPWEIRRPEIRYPVGFGGSTEMVSDGDGRFTVRWHPARVVEGVGYDTPILGYRVNTANLLRLWTAQSRDEFDFQAFNQGDFYGAVEDTVASETLTKILYPNDASREGKRLRLEQQYFFVSCSLCDMIRIYLQTTDDLTGLADKYAVQLNDTHPALAVPELMRLLVDEHRLPWERAWDITRRTLSYTNHTLMPEALERWSVPLFGEVLPRHLQLVYEINRRFLDEVRVSFPGDEARLERLSLIDESGQRWVRMAHLATVGSHTVNGVAALHSELLKSTVMADFHALWPERFTNITNGVTPRRFLALANPRLAALIDAVVGPDWPAELERLRGLEAVATDAAFGERFRAAKRANKADLSRIIAERTGVEVDPASLFDVQVKRIHAYKRQHLNVLQVIARYLAIKEGRVDGPPRTAIFAGKAAPGYDFAKLVIRLIHGVAEVVNRDPAVGDLLRVAFVPDFNVTNAQHIYPAADLSEQISTAGFEASGTGNMKFAMSGAVTIGTLDGANVEIRQEVGADNFFLFGLSAAEVADARPGSAAAIVAADPELARVLDLVADGVFSRGDRELFRPIVDQVRGDDPYMVAADFRSYLGGQAAVDAAFADRRRWTTMAVLNVARMGHFSSDRSIRDYCRDIWRVAPTPVHLAGE